MWVWPIWLWPILIFRVADMVFFAVADYSRTPYEVGTLVGKDKVDLYSA